jgi:DNA-binding CsgD family transcriptional regulator
MEMEAFGADREFVAYCYPQNSLKDGLTEREKELLKSILKENSYKWFLQELEAEEVTVNQLEDGQ